MTEKIEKRIKFNFHPNNFENNEHAIEKEDGEGRKRRYLCGISSGLKMDAHEERMTEKCIKSFQDQASSGDVLLFPDIHGIKETSDIGIMNSAKILDNGDWYTEYRLYDEFDDVGAQKLEACDTIWKQMNGLPPYKHKRQKGFSIEGIIPDHAIVMNRFGEIDRSVIDDISLDGVVLVPRPAYKDSIANAIYKALGEVNPYRQESIENTLRENVDQQEAEDNYYSKKWKYFDGLEQLIEKIMKRKNNEKEQELDILFDEFKRLMITLILNSEKMFAPSQDDIQIEIQNPDMSGENMMVSLQKSMSDTKLELFKSLYNELSNLKKTIERGKNERKKHSEQSVVS